MVSRAGATTVPAHTLHEIARKLPDGAMVELADDGIAGRLDVRAGRSHFSLRPCRARTSRSWRAPSTR